MLLSALLCLASACAPQASPSPDGLAAVRAVFQRTEGSRQAPEEVLVRRLVALGAGATPALFALSTGEALEALLGSDEEQAWLCPPDRIGSLAQIALGQLPEVPVRDFLRRHCSAHPEREARVAALRVLGSQGTSESLPLFLELCTASGEELEHRSVRAPAVAGLRALLCADERGLKVLEEPLLAATPTLQRLACEALGGVGRVDAVQLLNKLFGRDPELDLAALEALAALGERSPWLVGEPVAVRLRSILERGEPRLRGAAARALGRTRDLGSVPALVACLGAPDLASAASWALGEITGETRLVQADDWKRWLEAEHAWWEREGEAYLAQLDPRRGAALSAVLRELGRHPLGRERVVDALCAALPELQPHQQVLVSGTLAQLRARRSVPSLVDLLSARQAEVRDAAWSALRALTGADLPAEPRLWEDYAAGP